ncbi:MAG TPA: hypothetical protein VJH96_04560 [Patescibacteria group bacterium]|nr:hypothetical protein [Patescibacteria group bacterium]
MKTVGFILIAAGAALLIFVVYSFIESKINTLHSPVPEKEGIKVIYINF